MKRERRGTVRKTVAEKPFFRRKKVLYKPIQEFLSEIFAQAKPEDGFVCIRSGPASQASQSFISVGKLENFGAELSRHDYRDCFFSFATYKGGLHPQRSEARMLNIFAFGIDIDFVNESADPETVWDFISENTCLPKPSFIEFGHRLRLVYIFAEPLRLFPKQREALLRAFRLLQRCLCDYINEELSFEASFGAEPTPPTSFFRVPGSVNTKNGAIVKVQKISNERYTFQELFDEWILDKHTDPSGNRDEWYGEWKEKQSRRRKSRAPRFTPKKLWERRAAVLEDSRSLPCVHRRKTLFAYSCALAWLGVPTDEILPACLEFNKGFSCPLPDHKVSSLIRGTAGKLYKFTDAYLAAYLELPEGIFQSLSKKERDAQRYRKARAAQIRRGAAKFQKIEKRRKTLRGLLLEGCGLRCAAEVLGVSLSTIKRDASYLRETQFDCTSNNGFLRNFQSFLRLRTTRLKGWRADAAQSLGSAPALYSRQQGGGERLTELVGKQTGGWKESPTVSTPTPSLVVRVGQRVGKTVAALKNEAVAPVTCRMADLHPAIDLYIRAEKNEPLFYPTNPATI